jgi:two-component system, LuxR family, response regulator FixJ
MLRSTNVTISLSYRSASRGQPLPKLTKNNPPTVLVVDDDPSLLRAIGRLLRAAGFEARTFERPSLLLASNVPKSNACLVLDVYLPEMNGVQVFEALALSGRALPVIMITGQGDSKTKRLLKEVNAIEVLIKPFDGDLLLRAVERALSSGSSG